MARYDGKHDGLIRAWYMMGMNPNRIYKRLQAEGNGKAPCSLQTVYNLCSRFNREAQEKHTAERIISEAEAKVKQILRDAHFQYIAEMRGESQREVFQRLNSHMLSDD